MARGKGFHPKGEASPLWKGGKLEAERRYNSKESSRLKVRVSDRAWYQKNKDKWKVYHETARLKLKREVLSYYGNGQFACVRCGFDDERALSIDHINGGGNYQRKNNGEGFGMNIYYWLKRNNYPKGYQTLCMNCQFIKKAENKEQPQFTGNTSEVR